MDQFDYPVGSAAQQPPTIHGSAAGHAADKAAFPAAEVSSLLNRA